MLAPTINNLPNKFLPFLIGSPTCPIKKSDVDPIFSQPLVPLKDNYIFDAGDWVLKLPSADGRLTTPDSHIYRVRKAEKIRTYIRQNNLEAHVVIPQKYLYWHERENRFYVMARKMDLSNEVAEPLSKEIEASLSSLGVGQSKALAEGKPKRALTPIQAKTLAQLSFLDYTDLIYNNLFFTPDGKVAIVDAEPHKRVNKTIFKTSLFAAVFGDKGALCTQQSIAGVAKLKMYTSDPVALREVQKVERNHVFWSIAKLVAKIAAVSLGIYFIPAFTALIPIAVVATTVKTVLLAAAYLKDLILFLNTLTMYAVWSFSCQPTGWIQIVQMEQQGVI